MTESNISDDATVIVRAGKKTLEEINGKYVVSDGWLTDWIIFYPKGSNRRWSQDGTLYIPKKIREKLDKM